MSFSHHFLLPCVLDPYVTLTRRLSVDVERQTAGGLQSLGVAPVRLLAAAMVTAVTRHHCQHFHSAVDILRSLYDAGCHGDASDACVSYRRYAKLSAGLKVLVSAAVDDQ